MKFILTILFVLLAALSCTVLAETDTKGSQVAEKTGDEKQSDDLGTEADTAADPNDEPEADSTEDTEDDIEPPPSKDTPAGDSDGDSEPEEKEPEEKKPVEKEPEKKEPEEKEPEEKEPEEKEPEEEPEEPKKEPEKGKISHAVSQAPEVILPGKGGDIDQDGPCSDDIAVFCPNVKPGNAHVAECLQNQSWDSNQGATAFTASISNPCADALTDFKVLMASNINYDEQMAKDCKADAEKFCDSMNDIQDVPGLIIACLREKKPNLGKACQGHISKLQEEAADDFRIDALVYSACKEDASNICGDVEPGNGLVNICLRDHRASLSWDCQRELFRMDAENADNLRYNTKLFNACLGDKNKFCKEVAPGNSRAQACLEDNMNKPNFSDECKAAMEEMMEARSKDYRLDNDIRKDCQDDIDDLCSIADQHMEEVRGDHATVITCLQSKRDAIVSEGCRNAVARTLERSSDNFLFATGLSQACREDRKTFCETVKPGDARVIRCLQDQRERLTQECKASLFDHEVTISESIDYNKPMMRACSQEIEENCSHIRSGNSRIIRCLQDGNRKRYTEQCTKKLEEFEKNMGKDYRLNHRLEEECEEDVTELCSEVCEGISLQRSCEGTVLHCLVENKDKIKAKGCQNEVAYYIKMEVNNYGNDLILARACQSDVSSFCSEVAPGEGRVHECLRKVRSQLTDECRSEELKLEIEESSNFDLRTNIKQVCVEERKAFCGEVSTGSARVFRCLARNLNKPDFGDACKTEIMTKLRRRQENFRLDPMMRRACKDDAEKLCLGIVHEEDSAEFTRCLIDYHEHASPQCQHEVSRVAYMSLFVWQSGAPIAKLCEEDAQVCEKKSSANVNNPGKMLACLESRSATPSGDMEDGASKKKKGMKDPLSPTCQKLVTVAEPPDNAGSFENNMKVFSTTNAKDTMVKAGVWDNRKGVTITGYTALACFSALCTTVVMAVLHGYRKWRGIRSEGYVQVVKQGDL